MQAGLYGAKIDHNNWSHNFDNLKHKGVNSIRIDC